MDALVRAERAVRAVLRHAADFSGERRAALRADAALCTTLRTIVDACCDVPTTYTTAAEWLAVARDAFAVHRALWKVTRAVRSALRDETRVALWHARLHCTHLLANVCVPRALTLEPTRATLSACRTLLETATRQTPHDTVAQYAARHAWPVLDAGDDHEQRVWAWMRRYRVLLPTPTSTSTMTFDEAAANVTLKDAWLWLNTLRDAYTRACYEWPLLCVTQRVRQAIASFAVSQESCVAADERSALFGAAYNHPGLIERVDDTSAAAVVAAGDAATEQPPPQAFACNAKFFSDTERIFYAIDETLHRATCVVRRASTEPTELSTEERTAFDAFVAHFIETEAMHRDLLERDIQTQLHDFHVQPGEMEIFCESNPFDDARGIACIPKMRPLDFELTQRKYVDSDVREVWRELAERRAYTEPAYSLIAARVVHYYTETRYGNTNFSDAYYHDVARYTDVMLQNAPAEHAPFLYSRTLQLATTVAEEMQAKLTVLPLGSAAYNVASVCRANLDDTTQNTHRHALIVRCVGAPAVYAPSADSYTVCRDFASAFVAWLRCMVADERVRGVLSNGECVAPLLTAVIGDSVGERERRVVAACVRARERLFSRYSAVNRGVKRKK